MRIVTIRTISEYSIKHKNAKIPLLHWYEISMTANLNSLQDVKKDFNSVVYVGNNRYVFNIKGNDLRLIVIIIFVSKKIYIRFIGTHDEYNKTDVKNI